MNKPFVFPLLVAALLAGGSSFAQDLPSPKPTTSRLCRILLYVNGSTRALDYNDVVKVHAMDSDTVTFETSDGFVVLHHGPFTLIGPKSEFIDHARPGGRVRFFDSK